MRYRPLSKFTVPFSIGQGHKSSWLLWNGLNVSYSLTLKYCRAAVWYIGYDLPHLSMFRWFYLGNNIFATFTNLTTGYGMQLSRVMNVILAINRMTAMKHPLTYKYVSIVVFVQTVYGA